MTATHCYTTSLWTLYIVNLIWHVFHPMVAENDLMSAPFELKLGSAAPRFCNCCNHQLTCKAQQSHMYHTYMKRIQPPPTAQRKKYEGNVVFNQSAGVTGVTLTGVTLTGVTLTGLAYLSHISWLVGNSDRDSDRNSHGLFKMNSNFKWSQ